MKSHSSLVISLSHCLHAQNVASQHALNVVHYMLIHDRQASARIYPRFYWATCLLMRFLVDGGPILSPHYVCYR